MRVIVIIPAAGLGTRMNAPGSKPTPTSKQFAELDGVPIIVHTLRKFAAVPEVNEIYIAMRKPESEAFEARLKQEHFAKPVRIVEGGEHRQESVANALPLEGRTDDLVLVHDAVRPFVDRETIVNVIDAAAKARRRDCRCSRRRHDQAGRSHCGRRGRERDHPSRTHRAGADAAGISLSRAEEGFRRGRARRIRRHGRSVHRRAIGPRSVRW